MVQLLPLPVGPMTEYSKSRQRHFVALLVLQVLMAIIAVVDFMDIFSLIMNILAVLTGSWAFSNHMNITYVTVWGLLCFVHFTLGSVLAVLSIIGSVVTFSFSSAFMRGFMQCVSLMGVCLWWWLYEDFQAECDEGPRDLLGKFLSAIHVLRPDELPLRASVKQRSMEQSRAGVGDNHDQFDYGTRIVDTPPVSQRDTGFGASLAKARTYGSVTGASGGGSPFAGLFASPAGLPKATIDATKPSGAPERRIDVASDPFLQSY